MTVGRLLRELDECGGGNEELVEWMGYDRIEHFGYEMDNFRMGVVAATTANVAPKARGSRSLKPSDFYPASRSKGLTPNQERELAARRKKRGAK